jgi:hypothetical protein
MPATKRPSTSSLRRYIVSRPYVAIADIRRRFGLDPDEVSRIARNGTTAFVGLPQREAAKLQDLWERDEVGMELSVEVRAPVVVGVYPVRIARYLLGHGVAGPATTGPAVSPTTDSPLLPAPADAPYGDRRRDAGEGP